MADINYVNADKLKRAQDIVGNKDNPELSQAMRADWLAKIAAAKVDDPVKFVYEGLGGLIGGTPEHKEMVERQKVTKQRMAKK
jgi:ATP-dependent 26S proteasome regulatory subunit